VPERQVSHYKIVEKIGGGGMGVVYKAVDIKLGRTVALKFLPPGFTRDETARKRFIHEAQAASLLDHPNICSIYEIDETPEGQVFISMAYCEGASLRDRIKDGPLPVREVFELVFSVADGLSSAHQRGIVHRDVKPGNIIVTTEGFVKLIDFGLAKLADRSRVTQTGNAPGTLSYMSPEQVSGGDIDGRTDIWSLGVVAYEALTGKLPFQADIDPAMMYQILNEEPVQPRRLRSEIPADFESIVLRCLAKDPAARYAAASDLIRDLVETGRKLGWQSSGTYRTVIRVGSTAASRRRRIVLPLILLAVVVVVPLVVLWTTRGGSREPPPFTTEVRLAVLPFENLAKGSVADEFADGLSEWIARAFERASAVHRSMWTVPFEYTQQGLVASPSHAKDAFGVNRLVTGTIQRFGDGCRVSIELVDAGSLQRIRIANVDYQSDVTVLERGIVDRIPVLLGLFFGDDDHAGLSAGFTPDPDAFENYLRGLGHLQKSPGGDSLARAVENLRLAVQEDSTYAEARAALALALSKQCTAENRAEICDEMEEERRLALAADSSSAYVNLLVGNIDKDLKNYPEAIRSYRRIVDVEPKNAMAYRHMGIAFDRMDRVAEAESAFRAAVAAGPDHWEFHVRLGWFLDGRGRVDEAVEQYERALALAPNDAWTLNTLGYVSLSRDEWPRAREYFLRSFAINPRCIPCRNIGLLYYLEGLFADSAKYFKFALEYCDSTAADYYQRWQDVGAALYWAENRRGEATAAFHRAIALAEGRLARSPNDAELLAYLAGCHAMVGDGARAKTLLERFSAVECEEAHVLFVAGQTYEQLGDRERALQYIADAVRLDYRLSWIRAEPILKELTKDIRYLQLVDAKADEAQAGGSKTP
jgi:serine/threonine-protein kinase